MSVWKERINARARGLRRRIALLWIIISKVIKVGAEAFEVKGRAVFFFFFLSRFFSVDFHRGKAVMDTTCLYTTELPMREF